MCIILVLHPSESAIYPNPSGILNQKAKGTVATDLSDADIFKKTLFMNFLSH